MEDQSRKEKIKWLEKVIGKCEGCTLYDDLGNRTYGLIGLSYVAIATYHAPWLLPITIPMAIEFSGDIATGKHHFISYRILKIHPKYDLEKLLREGQEE